MIEECKHSGCRDQPRTCLKLVRDCHRELPEINMTLKVEEQKYYVQDDNYSVTDCCDLLKKGAVQGDITFYGVGVALDMLIKERTESEEKDLA